MTFAEPAASGAPEAKTAEVKSAVALVSHDLVQPLTAKEDKQGRFSRGRLPPQERRVRILDEKPRKDADGVAFLRFAIDARFGYVAKDDESQWRRDTITGCVYLERNQVFVKKGDRYRPAAFLLGKNVKAAAESTCEPAGQVADAN